MLVVRAVRSERETGSHTGEGLSRMAFEGQVGVGYKGM